MGQEGMDVGIIEFAEMGRRRLGFLGCLSCEKWEQIGKRKKKEKEKEKEQEEKERKKNGENIARRDK